MRYSPKSLCSFILILPGFENPQSAKVVIATALEDKAAWKKWFTDFFLVVSLKSCNHLISPEPIICSELIDDGLESDKDGNKPTLVTLVLLHTNSCTGCQLVGVAGREKMPTLILDHS